MTTEKQVRLVIPSTWTNDQRGSFFETLMAKALRKMRFGVTSRVRFTGMEIDLLADNLDTRQRIFAECKFQNEPIQSGVLTDLLGKALIHKVDLVYLFSTSRLGKEAKGLLDQRERDSDARGARIAFVGPDQLASLLIDALSLPPPPDNAAKTHTGNGTLLITSEGEWWAFEQSTNGIPSRVTIYPASSKPTSSFEPLCESLKEAELWLGLEIADGSLITTKANNLPAPAPAEDELITTVNMADRFDDYRPCRPQDFVGRLDLQKQVWSFLGNVAKEQTSTRIVCISGPSGFGKSSIVLKLSDRFKNKKWKKRLSLYPVDVRSAKGPLFITKALHSALQDAVDTGFISVKNNQISITSTEAPLSSDSVQEALKALKNQQRVLAIFFDQFEELFTKESLLSTFEAFRRLAFEVDAAKANIVLGFCWRTGISFSDDHPAYFMWQNLKDKRLDLKVGQFSGRETALLLNQFEKNIRLKLDKQLRRRLSEQSQGFPWLLKKLCIHVHHQISKGTSQEELMARKLNINLLFDEDLEPLSRDQTACLKYVAEHSPADIIDVTENFGNEVPNQLYHSRLLIRTGNKYAVYWDIFRDYILNGTVPSIPLTHIPQSELSMALKAIEELRTSGLSTTTTLAKTLGYQEKTITNVLADLQNLQLAKRTGGDVSLARPGFHEQNSGAIADHLASQLKDHAFVLSLYKKIPPGNPISQDELRDSLISAYPSADFSLPTAEVYARRMLPWLIFAGVLESNTNGDIHRPQGEGRQKGTLALKRHPRGKNSGLPALFMAASGPKKAVALAKILHRKRRIARGQITSSQRNALSDLVALGLATTSKRIVTPTEALLRAAEASIETVLCSTAGMSPFLQAAVAATRSKRPAAKFTTADFGQMIATALNRNWSKGSALRYGSAAKTWVSFLREHQNNRRHSQRASDKTTT
ncbi:nSTAND1 domain-containing NTPase [Myxococcus sp. NMCA1]|uniref:nSTAND1 domain-containing NTPase n=1 Tax=Myxococcus sp. NMCA1 TaxID=2996785 RepID=UPI002285FE73|nr:restriction endonuclease [Myxococcus sp. NMCA1]WAM28340.1 restriction endonuclease [Myxococcus sp. NMCA1]